MSDVLPFVVAGLASGSIFGLASMGLVLTYKTSGLFNFAHGAVAAAGAYVFYELHYQQGIPWPLAFVATILVAGVLFGLLLELIARRLVQRPAVTQILGTVGLMLLIQSLGTLVYGSAVRTFPPFLPASAFEVFGVRVGWDQLIVVVLGATAAAVLYAFFRVSRTGLAMRGVVDDPVLLSLAGTDEVKVRRTAWMIGASVAAASGVLIAPQLGLDAMLLTLLVVQAFGAAAVGRFTSLPLTYAGGLGIGVVAALSTKYVVDLPTLAGVPASLPFIVLFVALLVYPPRAIGGEERQHRAPVREWRAAHPRVLAGSAVVGGLGLLLVPAIVEFRLAAYTKGLAFVVIFLSLALLVNTSGQVSLCHAAFAAVGATTFSHLTAGAGLPWLLALLLAALVAVPLGAAVAVPAIRLSGIYLGLATLGFGLLLERLVFGTSLMFGGRGNRPALRPALFGDTPLGDTGYYYVVLAVTVATVGVMVVIHRTRLGRVLRALADSPVALATHGTSTQVTLVLLFCISTFFAALAGALLAGAAGSVSASSGFRLFDSLTWVVVLATAAAIWQRGAVGTAIFAAAMLTVIPSYLPDGLVEHSALLFGAGALNAALFPPRAPNFDTPRMRRVLDRAEDRLRHSPVRARTAGAA